MADLGIAFNRIVPRHFPSKNQSLFIIEDMNDAINTKCTPTYVKKGFMCDYCSKIKTCYKR